MAYDDSTSNRVSSLKCSNLEDSNSDSESDMDGRRKPKHIRWQMDYDKRNESLGMRLIIFIFVKSRNAGLAFSNLSKKSKCGPCLSFYFGIKG